MELVQEAYNMYNIHYVESGSVKIYIMMTSVLNQLLTVCNFMLFFSHEKN